MVFACASAVQADVIVIPDISNEPPNSPEGILRPVKGMNMVQVTEKFGEPVKKHDPVGDPPITRWDYKNFAVFFEYQYVLHSVVDP